MIKANFLSDFFNDLLVLGVGIRVHQHDGQACDDALSLDAVEVLADLFSVYSLLDQVLFSVRAINFCITFGQILFAGMKWAHTFFHFNHLLVHW